MKKTEVEGIVKIKDKVNFITLPAIGRNREHCPICGAPPDKIIIM